VHATHPASLDSAALSRRLSELAGHEREVQVEFLLHLAEYDLRRAWLEAGYGSLWDYVRSLHYREGATHRRIKAMRLLRRLPQLAEALRDGRICLTTAALLEPVMNAENAADLLARAGFKSKSEVEHLVVSLQPRTAPKDGVRRLPERREAPSAAALPLAPPAPEPSQASEPAAPASAPADSVPAPVPEPRATIRPVAEDTYSIHVKVDAAFKRELEELKKLLSHKVPNGDLVAVLREAIQCAIQKHGKRKGAVEPARKPKSPRPPMPKSGPGARDAIPAEVKRRVWERDQGCCAWVGPDGRRCGSTWMLEFDHIDPFALGGPSTFENVRVACKPHNGFHAEQTFGRAHMARFRREPEPRTGEDAAARGSGPKSGASG